jgi:hypothetical protein
MELLNMCISGYPGEERNTQIMTNLFLFGINMEGFVCYLMQLRRQYHMPPISFPDSMNGKIISTATPRP